MTQVPLLKKHPHHDPVKRFAPVSLVGRWVYRQVSTPALPVKGGGRFAGGLLAHARANPGQPDCGSDSGVTRLMPTPPKAVKTDTTRVPCKGECRNVTDVLGNPVQFTLATPASTRAPPQRRQAAGPGAAAARPVTDKAARRAYRRRGRRDLGVVPG